MTAKYFAILTSLGATRLANATALGTKLNLTQMAVGDANGMLPVPDPAQTKLINQKRIAPLNMLSIDPTNPSQIIAEQIIPEGEGGFWIREIGLYDDEGVLIAVANCPETYKPQLQEGSGRTQTIRMILIVSSTTAVTLKIDPSVVLATRKYVDDKALEIKVYVDDQMAKHIAAADPHTQYAQKDSPTFSGVPKAPTAAAGNNTTQLATTAFVQAALVALISGAPATLDTLKEIATAINNDPAFGTTMNNALALKAPLASPALTGTPTAPTAAQTTNNTQIATTAFVRSAITALIGSSPAALDTINELAAALGNDPNFSTTMINALAGKQPLNQTLTNLSGKDIPGLLEYLGLDRFIQRAGGTLFLDSNRRYQLYLNADGSWGVNDQTGNISVPLPVQCGGTGVTTLAALFLALGLGSAAKDNVVTVEHGGTGVTTLSALFKALGLGSVATENTLPVAKGGTGVTSLAELFSALGLNVAATRSVSGTGGNLPDTSMFAHVGGSPGYQRLPSGFTLQWGTWTPPANGASANISLPFTYTVNNYLSFALINSNVGNVPDSAWVSAKTGSTITLNHSGDSAAAGLEIVWISLGR